jgi:hypothetical protein
MHALLLAYELVYGRTFCFFTMTGTWSMCVLQQVCQITQDQWKKHHQFDDGSEIVVYFSPLAFLFVQLISKGKQKLK